MIFNTHSKLETKHAFLSPSKYHWINYDDVKLQTAFANQIAVLRGTQLHQLANDCITLGQKLSKTKKTLNLYVNDAIGYKMKTEQTLFYSNNCFGTADAISYKNFFLRIHDLKTGVSATSFHQLEVYTALFCLEYKVSPNDINTELRIYQLDEVKVYEPDPSDILYIMEKIRSFDRLINKMLEGE